CFLSLPLSFSLSLFFSLSFFFVSLQEEVVVLWWCLKFLSVSNPENFSSLHHVPSFLHHHTVFTPRCSRSDTRGAVPIIAVFTDGERERESICRVNIFTVLRNN
uniref:Secreted protein n=1 Tax=Astyanax mexicanus TaxID=7994 RepID=A0A8B9GPI1_ASTMX